LAADELHHQVGGLFLVDEVVNPRHDGNGLEGAEYFRLATEEVKTDVELLRIGTDHVLDGDGTVAHLGVGRHVDLSEAAGLEKLGEAISAVEDGSCRGGQG